MTLLRKRTFYFYCDQCPKKKVYWQRTKPKAPPCPLGHGTMKLLPPDKK